MADAQRQHNLLNWDTCGPVKRIHQICLFFPRSTLPLLHSVFAHPFIFLIFFFFLCLFAPDSCLYLFVSLFMCLPCLLLMFHSVLGGKKRQLQVTGLFCSPARCGSLRKPWTGQEQEERAGDAGGLLLLPRGCCALQCPFGSTWQRDPLQAAEWAPHQQWVSSVEVGPGFGGTPVTQIPNDFLMICVGLSIFISK